MLKKDLDFWASAKYNNGTYIQYYNRLCEIAISRFEWVNLPETIDQRFMELALFADGMALFFYDEALGYLGLRTMINGKWNVYNVPIDRIAYATNGYQQTRDETNSVIIYNNYLRTNSMLDVEMYAQRLYNIDRTIDVNVAAQKTPILIRCDEKERLSLKNIYMKYDGNAPVIMTSKSLDPKNFGVLNTTAPFVSPALFDLKTNIWNEALTFLGISNISSDKKERMITNEVEQQAGGTMASRFACLASRNKAAEQINKMFGLNISCKFREDIEADLPEQEEIENE